MKTLDRLNKIFIDKNDIKKGWALAVCLLAVGFKIALALTQYATVYPPLAPLDDDFMFRRAVSITQGKWLGEYSWLAISKHAFFAVWLALLHTLHIPFMAGNMALWAVACAVAVTAVAPALKKRYNQMFLFLCLLFNPAMSRQYASRIYRDAIFPSLCLVFFSGIIAVGLRYRDGVKKWLPFLFAYGASFGCIYLCREDGVWVLPFAVVALLIIALLVILEKRDAVKKIFAMTAPFALSALIICGYCYKNYQHYGRFIVSDFTSSEFKGAYGALTSLKQENWHPMVAVPEDVRSAVYREVDIFSPVGDALSDPLLLNGYYNKNVGDFISGSFYWALRSAVNSLGYYESPQKAEKFYTDLENEIQRAVDEGRLETENGSGKLRSSVTPPIKLEYVPAVWAEAWRGFFTVMTFRQCDPLAERRVGTDEEITPVEQFIHQKGARALIPYTETPYLSPVRALTHTALRIFIPIYSILMPALLLFSLIWQIKQLVFDLQNRHFDTDSVLNICLLGLLGMALLRCAMIAFVEVSSFGIGTYVMYLSTVHPLMIMYCAVGTAKSFED